MDFPFPGICRHILFLSALAVYCPVHGQADLPEDESASGLAEARTRKELLRQPRLQKLQDLQPYQQSAVEKVFLSIEDSASLGFLEGDAESILDRALIYADQYTLFSVPFVNFKGVTPKLGIITDGSHLSFGAGLKSHEMRGWPLDFGSTAAISLRGYQLYDIRVGEITREDERFFAYADLSYRSYPQEDFFGIGPDSLESDRTDFLIEQAGYEGVLGYRFNEWLGAAVRAGFLQVNVDPGTDDGFPDTQEVFATANLPGLGQQPSFFHVDSGLYFDYRDVPGNPHRGGILRLSLSRFDDRDSDLFEFNRYALDARQYLPLGSPRRVLAFRFLTSVDDAGDGNLVPFYFQETLGGSQILRGFPRQRFRGPNILYLSAEYRWEAAPALELAFFYDSGKVYGEASELNFSGLENSFGAGARLKTSSSVIFRLDVGRSNEGVEVHFSIGPSF